MPIAANLSYLGIAKEATPGTAAAATAFLPVTGMKPKVVQQYLEDASMRGAMAKVYNQTAGVQYVEYEVTGPAYPDTVGFALAGVLGDVTTTGAAAPYTHALAVLNSGAAPTYTISDYNGFNTRQFAGFRFGEVGLRFAGNAILEYTAKGQGRSTATTTKPTQSFSTVAQLPNWLAVATINNAASQLVTQGDVTIKRTLEPIHNTDGAAGPYDVFAGGDVVVEGSLTAVYEDDSNYNFYLQGTQVPLDLNWATGTGAAAVQIRLHMSAAQIIDADVNRANGRYVELAVKFSGIANTTDAGGSAGFSPIKATLQNALAAGTYK